MFERLRYRVTGSVLLWDVFATLLCLYASAHLRISLELGQELPDQNAQFPWVIYLVVALIWLVIFLLLTPQRALFTRGLLEAIGRLVGAVALASVSFAGVLYLSVREISRLQFIYFVVLDLLALLALHLLFRSLVYLRTRNAMQRRALIVGDPLATDRIAEEFARRPWTNVTVVGYTADSFDAPISVQRLGSINDTPRVVAEQQIDEVIFAMPPQAHERVAKLSLTLLQQPVMVHMVPGVLDLSFARTPVEVIGGIPLISLRESALTETQRIFKRMFDAVASAGLLLVLTPVLLLIALAIKLESPGPVFFMQERIGEQGRRFRMIKFRSMYQDADKRWAEVARRDESGRLLHKLEDDPRVTRVGRKLRRTSLDELPQLINVLKGEMSLVGPRPEMPYVTAEYEPWQWQRFRVPPGITGWWQVNGRSDKPMHLHTEDDLYYIQNYSFWLDLRILMKTVLVVWQGHGAY
jgi:exopolysaccharide biosynthesis polyprenyl glycosylphosphotransferase